MEEKTGLMQHATKHLAITRKLKLREINE